MERLLDPPSPEEYSEPDFLLHYGDQHVNEKYTLAGLADMCPFDLNDPSILLAKKNEYAVKFMNKAGLEIEPQHQARFDAYLQKKQLEPNYRLKQSESPKTVIARTTVDSEKLPLMAVAAVQPAKVQIITMRNIQLDEQHLWSRVDSEQQATVILPQRLSLEVSKKAPPSLPVEQLPGVVSSMPAPHLERPRSVPSKPTPKAMKMFTLPKIVVVPKSFELPQPEPVIESASTDTLTVSLDAPVITQELPLETPAVVDNNVAVPAPEVNFIAVEAFDQETELTHESFYKPKTVVSAFVENLSDVLTSMPEDDMANPTEDNDDSIEDYHETAAIVQQLYERMSDVSSTEDQLIEPLVSEIAEITKLLASNNGVETPDPEMLHMLQAQLTIVYEQLFQALELEITSEQLSILIEVLSRQAHPNGADAPLRNNAIGTHEIKRFKQKFVDYRQSQFPLHSILGVLAVLHAQKFAPTL